MHAHQDRLQNAPLSILVWKLSHVNLHSEFSIRRLCELAAKLQLRRLCSRAHKISVEHFLFSFWFDGVEYEFAIF